MNWLDHPLLFHADGVAHRVLLTDDYAPHTQRLLLASTPAEIDIHCAKIAGNHIFWHAPFVAPLEKVTDIMTIPAGAFVYWPERQFLELIYGELQAETASVNLLGRVEGDVAWLRALGERVQHRQGHEIAWARLEWPGQPVTLPAPPPHPLRAAREAVWRAMPAEVDTLLERRGVMLPYGPLAMAEGELRKLHELLWRLLAHWREGPEPHRVSSAVFLLEAVTARVAGFCHLTGAGAVLEHGAALLQRGEAADVDTTLEELVLYTGRYAAWLDQCIPWQDLNETLLAARPSRPRGHPHE